MRRLVPITLVLATASALAQPAAVPMEYPAEATPLAGYALREQLAGKVYTATAADGSPWRFDFQRSGYFYIDVGRGFRDSGKWRVDAPGVCFDLQKTNGGCNEIRASGDRLFLKRTSTGEVLTLAPK